MQPTVQPITKDLLQWFVHKARHGGEPVALGVEDRHLIWAEQPRDWDNVDISSWAYKVLTDRAERQSLSSPPIREVGVRWWPAGQVGQPPVRVITTPERLVDIDTADDYAAIAKRLIIQFLVAGSKTTGSGHIRRVLTLAEGLQHHDVAIRPTQNAEPWITDLINSAGWPMFIDAPDVFVFDSLGERWPSHYEWTPTVSLEDLTNGADYDTAVVNAMYGKLGAGFYTGSKYAVLRPEFTTGDYLVQQRPGQNRNDPDPYRVLIIFGGTDPGHLGQLTVDTLTGEDLAFTHYGPEDDISVAAEMHKHDLLITSGGRTVFEAAAVGIPTIVMCQNMRETTHTHLGVGNINLGLGRVVTAAQLRHVVTETLGDYELRRDMSETAKRSIDGHGADRVRRIIEHVGLYGEAP